MKLLIGYALLICLIAAGCGGPSPTPTSTPRPEPTATPTLVLKATPIPTGEQPSGLPDPTPTTPVAKGSPVPPSTSPTPEPVLIGLASTVREVRRGQEFSVDLTINPQARGISGVEVQMEYDPAIFQVIDAPPGDLLGQKPQEVQSVLPVVNIDNGSGILQYSDARVGPTQPPTPQGLLATMNLRVLQTATAGREASLRITHFKIADENIEEIGDAVAAAELKVVISP